MDSSKRRKEFWKWLCKGALGAVFFGSGISIAIEMGIHRYNGEPFAEWFLGGTAGIGLAVIGLHFIVDSVRHRIKLKERNDEPHDG